MRVRQSSIDLFSESKRVRWRSLHDSTERTRRESAYNFSMATTVKFNRAIGQLKYKLSDEKGQVMPVNWREHIVSTPDVLRGKPRIKGTRIPVSLILGYLASNNTVEQIMDEFPVLVKQQIYACLDYARDLSDFETVA
jgi:uncharacterized protein (DUF433 family)